MSRTNSSSFAQFRTDKMGGPTHKPEPEVIDLTKDRDDKDRESNLPVKKRRLEPGSPSSQSQAGPPVLEKASFEIPETSLLDTLNLRRAPRLEPEVPASSTVTTDAKSTGQSRSSAGSHDDKRVHHYYDNGIKQILRVVHRDTSSAIINNEIQEKIQRTVQAQKTPPENQAKKKLSVPNPSNLSNSKPRLDVVGPQPGPSPQRPRTRTKKHTIELSIEEFQRNPYPKSSEYFAIAEKSGLSVSKVKLWYSSRRKKMEIRSPGRDFASKDGKAAENLHSPNGTRSSTSTDADSEHLPHINPTSTRKMKYILPSDRTTDLSIIKSDFAKVKLREKKELESLLYNSWDMKANNLFIIATTRQYEHIVTIHKESRRLKQLDRSTDFFSTEQYEAVLNWKEQFTAKKLREGHLEHNVRKVLDDIIMMWLEPYIYSKMTKQNGQYLTLLTGLHDFCKLNDAAEFKWEIPNHLQRPIEILPAHTTMAK